MNKSLKKFCVIGDPIEHSLSPIMQNFFLKKFNISGAYTARQVKINHLKQALNGLLQEGVSGLNVTAPLKEEVLKFVDEITLEAKTIGSVNTLKFSDTKIIGHNTDAIGFRNSLSLRKYKLDGKNAIVVGAGGAARAVMVGLIREKCKRIIIINRDFNKATKIVTHFMKQFSNIAFEARPLENTEINNIIKSCQLLVNATTVGMGDLRDQSILSATDSLHKDLLVYDLIYRPYRSRLIQQAESCGVPWINGLDMLIFQGFESLKFWHDSNLMWQHSYYLEVKDILRRELCQE